LSLLLAVFSLSLYPYVYLLAKSAFETLDPRMPEAARMLGGGGRGIRLRLSVPWILGGASLVFMETIADYGTVVVFNFDTVTVAILKAWHGLFSFEAAARIAALLAITAVLVVTLLESPLRRRAVVGTRSARLAPARKHLKGLRAFAAFAFCGVILSLGFFVPIVQLLFWAIETETGGAWSRISSFVWNSFGIGTIASGLTLAVSLLLALSVRFEPTLPVRAHTRIATLGYALPGAVLAVAIHAVVYAFDRAGGAWLASMGVLWVAALLVRFTNVGFQPFRRGFERISPRLDEASLALGAGTSGTIWRVHRPLLLRAGAVAALLVFVDVVKEMPITLMTRPSGFETLALRVHQFTSEGLWAEAAFPALLIGMVGIAPALLLGRGDEA
jgi:iron(III) transport system permease protein